MQRQIRVLFACAVLTAGTAVAAAEPGGDAGETKEAVALKHRAKAPAAGDIDAAATVDALLAKSGAADWSQAKAAKVQAYVIQVEKEEDGDVHLALATTAGESDTHRWLIAEVTPSWAKKKPALSAGKLRALAGKKVEVTGWLYYEPDANQEDPRGTRWEIHPVTEITPQP
jgi:hypothetical protein